ncbi:flagellar export protein FliJ [Rhodohalobacter sp. SW132]|uniref:flagellar export protein FliJ n=1 Tax=Rhodohalobacter sp. SW132 TaxID=2293433 RepID=UPI000E25C7CD|nr:flagellar export protein FliJ [Rhodohalobacter sp. SW132]REL38680.1 flagellar export protein FliJ [Rhodohalobacter sp. SW132]
MAFKFSLESVLKVRKHQEKVQKQKLAEELMKKKKIDDVKVEVQNKLNHYLETDSVQTAANIQTIKRHGRHVLQTHELIRKLGSESQEADKSVSEVRNSLADAHKECHILEKLKEVEQQMFSKKIQRSEQKTMDEIATQSFSR